MYIRRPMCFLALAFMVFIFIATESIGGVNLYEYCHDYKNVTIQGVIKDKAYKNNKNILYIEDVKGDYRQNTGKRSSTYGLIVYLDEQDIDMFRLGQQVVIEGKYSNFSMPDNEGEFNMRKYYRIHGFEASITNARVVLCTNTYGNIRGFLYEIKENTKNLFTSNMSATNAGTLTAMVLGDKSELDSDIKELYQRAGVAHILAMSGLHIATVGLCLFSVIKRLGMHLIASATVSSTVMVLYGMMTGMSTSTFRALIMFLLGVLAECIGRTYDLMSAVCVSSIIILIENPYYIYDSGFLMSVLSVVGIGVIYPEITGALGSIIGEKIAGSKITSSLCISVSATISTLPVVVNSFYKISKYGIFANLIIVPLMSVVLFIGLFTGIMNLVFNGRGVSFLYTPLFFICEKILDLYSFVAGKISGINGNVYVTGKAETWNIVIYILLMLVFVICKWKWKLIIPIVAVFTLLFHIKPDMNIKVLYVGQGACNVIYGSDVPTILIDGGSTDVKDLYKYKVKPNLLASGIDEIEYLFITHPDEDHISAVRDLVNDESQDIKIDKIVLSIVDESVYEKLNIKALQKSSDNFSIYQMNRGQRIEGDKYLIEAVSPELKSGFSWEKVDANEASLVIKLTHKSTGFSALFTGDIDSDTEKELINNADLKNMSFMTVAHHGSRGSSSDEFLKYVNPKISTISAGRNNCYGHPHKETLERLESDIPDSAVLRTDECGQITVRIDDGKIYLRRFCEAN